jgi:excisionase family DNA binding protein
MLSVAGAAERLGVSRSVVYRLVAAREITFCRVGGAIRIEERAVEEYLAAVRVPAVPAEHGQEVRA